MYRVDESPGKNKAAADSDPSVVITGSTRGLGFALVTDSPPSGAGTCLPAGRPPSNTAGERINTWRFSASFPDSPSR